MSFTDDPEFNPYVAPKEEVVFIPYQAVDPLHMYAGFWRRVGAFMIDTILIWVVSVVINMVTQLPVQAMVFGRPQNEQTPYLIGVMLLNMAIDVAIYIIYFALMESSSSQATVGKMALGIVVTDLFGRRISFGRSLGRAAGRYLAMSLCYIGLIMAAFTARQQGLHDMMASTLVLRRQ